MVDQRIAHAKHANSAPRSAWDFATAGTYRDYVAPRGFMVCVLVIALLAICIPLVGMIWAPTNATTENRELAAAPALFEEDRSFNYDVLADAGSYFEDHFAYRNQLVEVNARLHAALGTSPTDQVVIGTDDWLYYGGTLPDYLGQSSLSERGLRNAAHNLGLVQRYVQAHDAVFAFTLAPNKNTLYPQHMPYYYLQTSEPSNAERLKSYLAEEDVNYIDLFEVFDQAQSAGTWYLKRDSHWDNRGALLATQALLKGIGRSPMDLSVDDAQPRDDFVGDLQSMLHPYDARTEVNWYFSGYNDDAGFSGARWSYVEGSDVTDSTVRTAVVESQAQEAKGTLVMYRDSFGNALLPLWSTQFAKATYSKLVPYDIAMAVSEEADVVIIERAERHASYFAETAPLMPSPTLKKVPRESGHAHDASAESGSSSATVDVAKNGPYTVLSGEIAPELIDDTSRITIAIDYPSGKTSAFNAFWISGGEGDARTDWGYQVNLTGKNGRVEGSLARVLVTTGASTTCVGEFQLDGR